MRARGGVQLLVCGGCGDSFELPHRLGRRPELCADCRKIRNEERRRQRFAEAQARKLADLSPEAFCQDCGKPVEGYRRGRPGGVPKFCRAHSRERRKRRNRRSARRSYERRKAGVIGEPFMPPGESGAGSRPRAAVR